MRFIRDFAGVVKLGMSSSEGQRLGAVCSSKPGYFVASAASREGSW